MKYLISLFLAPCLVLAAVCPSHASGTAEPVAICGQMPRGTGYTLKYSGNDQKVCCNEGKKRGYKDYYCKKSAGRFDPGSFDFLDPRSTWLLYAKP
ncbi:hypothetical protein OHS59_00400 [Streptomyces sp. NBC_00414]|uniref:hypothetical protein n=1 Tax=Streptomyces sp. NBC_00414 TaxID=2975739 RepID=UPI002E208712